MDGTTINVVVAALQEIEAHALAGDEGYRQVHDRALWVVIALKNAGLKIVKAPVKAAGVPA